MRVCVYTVCVCVCVHCVCVRERETNPVYDARCMQVFDTTQHLIKQVRQTLVVQLHLNHLTQVSIHQLHHQIPAEREGVEGGRNREGERETKREEIK